MAPPPAPAPPALRARPRCPLCAAQGERVHAGLRDRLCGATGEWAFRRCPEAGCGLLWLDPAPRAEDLPRLYAGYHTHAAPPPRAGRGRRAYDALKRGYQGLRYGRRDATAFERALGALLFLHPGRRADADFDAMYLRARPGAHALDVGCGSGRVLRNLAALGWDARGIDFDPAAVEACRAQGLRADIGGLDEQGFAPESFDALTASHVLEHLPEPAAFLRACARVLAPGGTLVVVTPNAEGLGHRAFGPAWRGLEPPRHLQVFTRASLSRLAQSAGLADFEVRVTQRNARGIHRESRALRAAQRGGAARAEVAAPGLRSELWQLGAWAASLLRPGLGEELVLMARR
jgi:2-polyprenyl-3-methyl-5-hydroxy-6-metoxy-1,4-benzoquinol methylase